MRNLTAKQKKLLKEWYKNTDLVCVDDLTDEQWNILEKINDTEILYQNVNAFLNELNFNGVSD